MVKEITDQYAAAWIEARGQVQTNVGGVGRSRPQMRVTALDPAVPDALAEYFGLGKIDTFTPRTAPHLTLYVWQVRGKAAAEVLERAAPYMVAIYAVMLSASSSGHAPHNPTMATCSSFLTEI